MLTVLLQLLRIFLPLSFLTIGGGQSIIPAIHYQSVEVHQWVSNREFLDLFALTRLTPGPKSLLVSLIGWKAAGLLGAAVATFAIFVPSAVLVYFLAKIWQRYEATLALRAIEQGLAPVAAGMILAATATILKAAEGGIWAWSTAIVAAILLLRTRINPFILLASGGLIFYLAQPAL
ncbi:chromate transporter [Paenalcaligenes niemegkensis]|uniref:chromate transporter n=1 Tax=Paenalcaligenes niemegkensis TaxID=2895469 RepID=UPI001EE90A1B|nr:chromate transporter [Paenalcaligenes niemegkensis]MCQ9618166.1 chromate transporter [Paenalcaligenes niemegkensis]